MSSRIRAVLVAITSLMLAAGGVALSSSSAQAAVNSVTSDSTSYTVSYPNSPGITLHVSNDSATPVNGDQVSLTNGSRIFATGTVQNGQATLSPADPDTITDFDATGWLPIGSYTFVAHFRDAESAPISVTVTTGKLNFNITKVTDNGDSTANFEYFLAALGTQTDNTRPNGIVALQGDGVDITKGQFVSSTTTTIFTGVTYQDGVQYRLHWWGTDEYPGAFSDTVTKGGPPPTTTSTTSTSTSTTSTSTTLPTTTSTLPTSDSTTTTTSPSSSETTTTTTAPTNPAPVAQPQGYRLVESDGTVRSYGVQSYGDASRLSLNAPIISAVQTPSNQGYWLLGADGGIFTFGDAQFYGSMGGKPLNKPIVSLTPTASGKGYWLVASDGGIFAFGDAKFYGSMGGKPLNKPIVGITVAADGNGYRMVASDGGIFSFGSAQFYGSMGGQSLNKPVIGMTRTPDGNGYWLVAADGGIFSFGNAGFYGSTGNIPLNKPIVAMRATPSGNGYWFVASDGGVFAYGDAGFVGSAASTGKTTSTVAMS